MPSGHPGLVFLYIVCVSKNKAGCAVHHGSLDLLSVRSCCHDSPDRAQGPRLSEVSSHIPHSSQLSLQNSPTLFKCQIWTNLVCICSPIQAQVSDSLLSSEQVGWCGLTQLECGIQINLVSNFHHVNLDYNYEHCRRQVMLMPPNCQIGTNLVNNCPPAFTSMSQHSEHVSPSDQLESQIGTN